MVQEHHQHKAGEMLRLLLYLHGIDETELSRLTGVSRSNISRLKNDPSSNPTFSTLHTLAKYFSVTVSQLLGEEPLNRTQLAQKNTDVELVKRVPLLKWEEIIPWVNDRSSVDKSLWQWISTDDVVSQNAFAVKIQDKTLGLVFRKHAILIVDPSTKSQDGDYVLVCEDSNLPSLKQLIFEGNRIFLKSIKSGINVCDALDKSRHILGVVTEIRYKFEEETMEYVENDIYGIFQRKLEAIYR